MKALLDNQLNAITKLQHLKVGALYMDPGTGKTLTAWKLAESIPGLDYVIWFTPFQNKANQSQMLHDYGALSINIDIVGIETISSSDRTYLSLIHKIEAAKCPAIVVDESLKIKNWDAKRTKRIVELGKMVEYKLILNGTPISRNLLDVWAQFEFLSPKILNMGLAEFKNTFCEYTRITKRFGGYKAYSREFITRYHNVDYLYSLIQPYVFECDLNLEVGKQYIDIDFSLDKKTSEEYYRIKEEYLNEKLQYMNNNIFLELTQKMQHLYTNSSEKFDILEKFLKESERSKILIFRKYLSAETELKKRYPDVRVLSIQSESLGLNLQDYDTIIIWDKVWDYALIKQMEHRIWRIGQTAQQCRFVNLNGNVGLERMMMDNINKKGQLLKYFKTKALKEAIKEL